MRAIPLPAGALLSRSRWRDMGVSSKRLAGTQFVRPLPGLLTPRAFPAWFDDIVSALQRTVIPGAVLSHTTAAVLYGVPVPLDVDDGVGLLLHLRDPRSGRRRLSLFAPRHDPKAPPLTEPDRLGPGHPALTLTLPHLHCRVPPGSQPKAGRHVTVHRMAPGATRRWRGLILSSPPELLLELALLLEHDEVVIAIDHFLGPNSSLPGTTCEAVGRALEPYRGRPGYRRVMRALADAREGVESPGETRTRLLVTRAGFPEPTPNLRVQDPDKGTLRRIDNAYASHLIGIEYDGDIHRSKGAWREEHARRDSLESAGWTLRRLTAADIREPGRFLSALRRTFLAAGAPAPPESAWQGDAGAALRRPITPPPRRSPSSDVR
ncbi:hypothetical protein ACT3SQ_10370 [Brachybacterium sp. AOP42-C2-15]|uniref:hypothetical protein n=1 Tax=unclassified Brachybacterium TaxID=2623841 RepID=UPI003F90C58C